MGAERGKRMRNIAIVLLLAAAVWGLPNDDVGREVISSLINSVFWAGLVFFAYKLYMERRHTVAAWEDNLRTRLYLSTGLMIFLIAATLRMLSLGGLGTFVWLALLGVALWGVFTAVRGARAY